MTTENELTAIEQATRIVTSYVGANGVLAHTLPELIRNVHHAIAGLSAPLPEPVDLVPAVPIKKSVTDDYIICLDDGKKFKSMKRHIAKLGMTPDEYRAKWGLPSDYPLVCKSYSERRSQLAKDNGLGRK